MKPAVNQEAHPGTQRIKMTLPKTDIDAIDRILAAEEGMVPSSGFAAAVMERVRDEAATPTPMPFPWRRFVPGLALAAGVFEWSAWQVLPFAWPAMRKLAQNPPQIPLTLLPQFEDAGWVLLALAAALGAWMLSTRMVRRSGML